MHNIRCYLFAAQRRPPAVPGARFDPGPYPDYYPDLGPDLCLPFRPHCPSTLTFSVPFPVLFYFLYWFYYPAPLCSQN